MRFTLFVACLVAASSIATPIAQELEKRAEPKYVQSTADLAKGLVCPTVSSLSQIKKPFLLMPGTGVSGKQSWGPNYVKVLPSLGYQPCYINTPSNQLADAQLLSEYVVYAVKTLSAKSTSGKLPILTWSLGGPITQWALQFWPSTRSKISHFYALAPDFRGAEFAQIGGFTPSIVQQKPGSNYLTALKKFTGLNAIVPTTIIYSTNDEIVTPETGPDASSPLGGSKATNIIVQDACKAAGFSGTYTMRHFDGLAADPVYQIISKSLKRGGAGKASDVTKASCGKKCFEGSDCNAAAGYGTFLGNIFAGPKGTTEPALQPYAK